MYYILTYTLGWRKYGGCKNTKKYDIIDKNVVKKVRKWQMQYLVYV